MNTNCLSAFSARSSHAARIRLADAPTDYLQGVDITDVRGYHGSLQGLGQPAPYPIAVGAIDTSLPTDIQSIATSVSQAIQATTNPNMPPFTGNLVGTPAAAAAGIGAGTLLLLGAVAFLMLRRNR